MLASELVLGAFPTLEAFHERAREREGEGRKERHRLRFLEDQWIFGGRMRSSGALPELRSVAATSVEKRPRIDVFEKEASLFVLERRLRPKGGTGEGGGFQSGAATFRADGERGGARLLAANQTNPRHG